MFLYRELIEYLQNIINNLFKWDQNCNILNNKIINLKKINKSHKPKLNVYKSNFNPIKIIKIPSKKNILNLKNKINNSKFKLLWKIKLLIKFKHPKIKSNLKHSFKN